MSSSRGTHQAHTDEAVCTLRPDENKKQKTNTNSNASTQHPTGDSQVWFDSAFPGTKTMRVCVRSSLPRMAAMHYRGSSILYTALDEW